MIAAALATAILHSLWQGVLAVLVVLALDVAFAAGRAEVRHGTRVVALAGWLVAFVVTAWPSATPSASGSIAAASGLPVVLCWGWAVGVAGGIAHVGLGLGRLHRLRRTASVVPAHVQALADRIATHLAIARVRVVEHAAIATPCVVGVLRPILMLPLGLVATVSPEVLRVVLVHELVHVRRLDPWINAMVVVARVLLFFHPAAWWLAATIRAEREFACDAQAAAECGGPLPYGRGLLALAAWPGEVPLSIPAAGGATLRPRIERLVARRHARTRSRAGARAWAIAGCLAMLGISPVPGPARGPVNTTDPRDLSWLPASVRRHEAQIVAAALRHGIDPRLVGIVVLVESGGDPRATSPVGARGLMQLMPATAADLARRRGEPAPTLEQLYDPARSLDLGAEYLARQLRAFGNHPDAIELAAAAYNAGPGRVRAWQAGRAELPDETRRYRARVGRLWRTRVDPSSSDGLVVRGG